MADGVMGLWAAWLREDAFEDVSDRACIAALCVLMEAPVNLDDLSEGYNGDGDESVEDVARHVLMRRALAKQQ